MNVENLFFPYVYINETTKSIFTLLYLHHHPIKLFNIELNIGIFFAFHIRVSCFVAIKLLVTCEQELYILMITMEYQTWMDTPQYVLL